VVEFHRSVGGQGWLPFPVEYKRGKPKPDGCDKVQLCAQALCLEEMLGVRIEKGAIFYGKIRHRLDVVFDEDLRKETKATAALVHDFIEHGKTPRPIYSKKCESCSLLSLCMPRAMQKSVPVEHYIRSELHSD
jgi:CRISPR-associated exonuclease Cas4